MVFTDRIPFAGRFRGNKTPYPPLAADNPEAQDYYKDIDWNRSETISQLVKFCSFSGTPTLAMRNHELLGYHFTDIQSRQDHCRIYYNDKDIIVTFEGSNEADPEHNNRNLDAGRSMAEVILPRMYGEPKMLPSPLSNVVENGGKTHPGFAKSLYLLAVDDKNYQPTELALKDAIEKKLQQIIEENPDRQVSCAGHSAGAALAGIFAGHLLKDTDIPVQDIFTYASPRYCGKHYGHALESAINGSYFRFEMLNDPVPAWARYEKEYYIHPGKQIVFDDQGQLITPCCLTGHSTDSYSHPMQAAIYTIKDMIHLNGKQINPHMDRYHYQDRYCAAIGKIATEKTKPSYIDNTKPKPNMPALGLGTFNSEQKDEAYSHALNWMVFAHKTMGDHLSDPKHFPMDDNERIKIADALADFEAAINNRNLSNSEDWFNLSVNRFSQCYSMISEAIPFDQSTNMEFERGLLSLEKHMQELSGGVCTIPPNSPSTNGSRAL